MNKDKKIERLEQKIAKAQKEIKELKSDVRKAKRANSKASKKKRRQGRNAEQRTATITFEAVKRYTYSGFMIMTAFLLCIYVGSSPRKAAKSIEDSFVVSDGLDIGHGKKIPLWLFGLLY